ncbi:MAG: ribosome biogenesis/translation initiation ATPase RLI [Candidatus Nanoarchaeia archaeon]
MTRIAVVNKKKCQPEVCGNYLCINLCPVNRTGAQCIVKSEDNKIEIDEKLCTGCGICQNRCPTEAISIINLPQELNTAPIHRYGKNGFALYSLPSPMFGKVTGIIGRNGIGKSTAIKILAGLLNPNFGEEGKEATTEELIQHFKGTEKQNFFEKLKTGEIKVSYKPQNVDMIPKTTNGKVKELLEKVDEKGKLEEIAEMLDIKNVLDRDIKKVSGGELQRIAIAASVLKKANLYIFDEPTSYLDIKQRLKVSRFVRKLADESTAVMVIEHDLVALDYLADVINIMYGKENAYGVVSNLKSAKPGINSFLEGFLKEENVRFRNNKITFEVNSPVEHKPENLVTKWSEFQKNFEGFSLKASEGDACQQEVLGVLGENGIGKTTFVKVLAGVEKPDIGEIDKDITVSYKPQYIDSESDEMVVNVLQKALQKHKNDIIMPLELEGLLNAKINELSGGQLQRVAIAKALSEDAQMVLLDEPSAYLDVEQRLIVSKVIRNLAATRQNVIVVVDHDLVFVDAISNRLLVFEGLPAHEGHARGPFSMEEGMNNLLRAVDITLRRDDLSGRPRINKENSIKDREQKEQGRFYYA